VKFLVDNQLPVALARFLDAAGWEAKHVIDLKLEVADDRKIWSFAKANDYVLISNPRKAEP
jgi:predicted nuclease of predicted toxin-antitoxin system